MTGYYKIAISLPLRAAESARRAVKEGRAASVSAYVASAIEEKSSNEDLIAMLDESLEKSGGPLTIAERNWARKALGLPLLKQRGKGGKVTTPVRTPRSPRKRRRA